MKKEVEKQGTGLVDPDIDEFVSLVEQEEHDAVRNGTEQDDRTAEERDFEDRVEAIRQTVRAQIEEAMQHYEEHLQPDQVEATEYYFGRPFGDEEEGRSKVVSTDLRDTVLSKVPSLMKIFLGPEKVVEFRGRGPEDDAMAKQATDHTNYVVREENSAFRHFNALFKDALVRRVAAVKWWWDEFYRVEEEKLSGLTMDEAAMLASNPNVEVILDSVEFTEDETGEPTLAMRVRRKHSGGCERYAAIPPEEIFWTPGARSTDEAQAIIHARMIPADEARALGASDEDIEAAQGQRERSEMADSLKSARQFYQVKDTTDTETSSENVDASQRQVLWAEAYVLIDGDFDGRAERRLFHCIGPDFDIVNHDENGVPGEIVDEVPIAIGTMEEEPHTIVGLSDHDFAKDIQRINSQIEREMLNSLGRAVEPKEVVDSRVVNMADLTNPDVKGLIRTRGDVNNSIREITHDFVGPQALSVLAYYSDKLERRTGREAGASGLDADALQSTDKDAVQAVLTSKQERLEMIARTFAETIFKPLFRGLFRLSIKHRNHARMIRLRNQWVNVDPTTWDAEMDVHINVGLGQGLPSERMAFLQAAAAEMREQLAAGSPLASWAKYRNLLGKIGELAGFTNPDEFWNVFGPEEEMQMRQQMVNAPQQSDPAADLVKVKLIEVEVARQKAHDELALKEMQIRMEDDRERNRLAREHERALLELELKYGKDIQQGMIDAAVEHDRHRMDAELERERMQHERDVEAERMAHEAGMAADEAAPEAAPETAPAEEMVPA